MPKPEKIKRPSFQFYPADWSADIKLRSASLAARGLWIEILCILHQSDSYGYFPSILQQVMLDPPIPTEPTGAEHSVLFERVLELNPELCEQLSRMVGASTHDVAKGLRELARAQVFSFSPDGRVYSKRMVNDEVLRNFRKEAGKLGAKATWHPDSGQPKPELAAAPLAVPGKVAVAEDVAAAKSKVKAVDGSGVIGNLNDAYYRLEGEKPFQLLKLTVTEAGMDRLGSKFPGVNIMKVCGNMEFFWNTDRGRNNRPTAVFQALSNACRKELQKLGAREAEKNFSAKLTEEDQKKFTSFVNTYNAETKGFASEVSLPLTFDRIALVRRALEKNNVVGFWKDVFAAIRETELPPNCGFDWLLKDEGNWLKVKERTYKPRHKEVKAGTVNAHYEAVAQPGATISSGFGKKAQG